MAGGANRRDKPNGYDPRTRNFQKLPHDRWPSTRALARPKPKFKANLFRRDSQRGHSRCPNGAAPGPKRTRPAATPESREAQPPRGQSTHLRLRSPRSPPTSTSKKTRGLLGLEGFVWGDGCDILTRRRVWKRIPGTSWLRSHRNPRAAGSTAT